MPEAVAEARSYGVNSVVIFPKVLYGLAGIFGAMGWIGVRSEPFVGVKPHLGRSGVPWEFV